MRAHEQRTCPKCGDRMRPVHGSDKTVRDRVWFLLRCQTCGRVVMLDRESFLKRRKALVSRGAELANPSGTMI